MINVSSGMKSICEAILGSSENRRNAIKDVKDQAKAIRADSRRFLSEIRADLKEAKKSWNKIATSKPK